MDKVIWSRGHGVTVDLLAAPSCVCEVEETRSQTVMSRLCSRLFISVICLSLPPARPHDINPLAQTFPGHLVAGTRLLRLAMSVAGRVDLSLRLTEFCVLLKTS